MSILSNALSGSNAAQASIYTTSQNIANLQTKGYTRQGVLLNAMAPGIGNKSAGTGVAVGGLLRFSDSYKSQQMWRAASELGAHSQSQAYLSQLERVMGDDKSSLSNGVDEFFKALNAAGVDPTSTPLRQQVVTAANSMAQHFNSIYNVTANQRLSVRQQTDALLPSLNSAVASIARLNERISGAAASGTNTSALVDERDLAVDSLASMVAIETIDQPDGSRTVSLRTGQPLVIGKLAGSMSMDSTSGSAVLTLTFGNSKFGLDDTKVGGQLGGLANFDKNTLVPLQQSIAEMADQMSTMVNDQLALGFDMNGLAGKPLFNYDSSSTTGMLQIDPAFRAADLAFSSDGLPGDSANLQKLVTIKNQPVTLTSVGAVLLGDADTQLVGKLGIDSQQNQALLNTATTIRQQTEDDWKSTSGVNQDEEAVNLVEFQNMYQANMKVIAVANSMFDATLAMFN